MKFKKVIFIICDSVGVGALPDAENYGDSLKYNTIGNIAKKRGFLNIPNLESLGIANLTKIKGLKAKLPTNGFVTKCAEKSKGKDTSTGHWELANLITHKPLPTFPNGFPKAMIDRFVEENNLPGILCNKTASGTEVIQQYGDESIKTGKPIVYTSADSVFQIAAHEEHFGLDRLYKICESARKLCDEYRIARVIARPFNGTNASNYARTSNRKDYSIALHGKILFDYLNLEGIKTHTIGKVSNIYNHQGIASNIPSKNNEDGIDKLLAAISEHKEGLIMVNLVDFDQNFGHRRNVEGYATALEYFDKRLPEIMLKISPQDLLVIVADHGNDPTAKGTDHTREYVPFIAYSPAFLEGKVFETRKTFADVGSTIFNALTGKDLHGGVSLIKKMKMEKIVDESSLSAYAILDKKKRGEKLTKQEIHWFIKGLTEKRIADYQMTALLMAIWIKGMDAEETAHLTDAMLFSGKTFDFDNDPKVIDKHSTGGVGDKTSFILAPIAAAAGVKVPMIAGRGLGHTGGTVDKIEAIKGFQTEISMEEFKQRVLNDGIAMIGQTGDIAPADKKIYSLRDVTATVDSIPLITASIMSKKLAEGTKGLVIDLKCGNGAFMKTKSDAKKLAISLMKTASRFNKHSSAMITDMSQPLGRAIGNSLEIIESIETLKGNGPKDLTNLSVELAGSMIHLAGIAKTHAQGNAIALKTIKDGTALQKFRELIENQGGDSRVIDDYSLLPIAECQYEVKAKANGYVKGFQTEAIGLLSVDLGGGRKVASDKIDFGVGFILHKKVGDKVAKDETILTIYHNSNQLDLVKQIEKNLLEKVISFSKTKPKTIPLIMEKLITWSDK